MKEVRPWGNSGGVLLPREWIGKQVKIVLVDRSLEIKKEVLRILEPWLDDVMGIYLVGSYARTEQTEDSDIDILVVSKEIRKAFTSGKYEIEIIPLKNLISLLERFPAAIYPKIIDAEPIINRELLEEIREIKITKKSMAPYIKSCKQILKTHKRFIEDDKKSGSIIKSYSVIYSTILRLKALYIMRSILGHKQHTNEKFKRYLISGLNINEQQLGELLSVYYAIAHNKKIRAKIPIPLAESLINLLEKEIKIKNGKKKKEA